MAVKPTVCSWVAVHPVKHAADLLVGDEDLERGDEVSVGDALVGLPVLESLNIVEEDDEIVSLALEVDLALLCAATSHDDCWRGVSRDWGKCRVSIEDGECQVELGLPRLWFVGLRLLSIE
jgi:hypothetical protein